MAFRASYRKGTNVMNVVRRLVTVVLGLWIGGVILLEVGNTMIGTCSPFYNGMTLIGWRIGTYTVANAAGVANTSIDSACIPTINPSPYILYDTVSQAGILAVVGLIALAGVILSFIKFQF